jgi:hypothetical protein
MPSPFATVILMVRVFLGDSKLRPAKALPKKKAKPLSFFGREGLFGLPDIFPTTAVHHVLVAIPYQDIFGLGGPHSTSAKDDHRAFAFELIQGLLNPVQRNINSTRHRPGSKFARSPDIHQKSLLLKGIPQALGIALGKKCFKNSKHKKGN